MKTLLFATLVTFTSLAYGIINLDAPEVILQKASIDRQNLRDVVLSLETQLPEMRDLRTFESYFFLCDKLQEKAIEFNLDDLYPGGVKSLATKMAGFGVKWVDLSKIDQPKLAYYLKWIDIDGLSNLLSYAAYYSKKLTDVDSLKHLSDNIDFIIANTTYLTKDRFDVEIGMRELSTTIAIKFLLRADLSDADRAFWASKVYTSSGLSLYTDQVQQKIYGLKPVNKAEIHTILVSLELCFKISDQLIDAPTTYIKDRISDLFVETVKKSFELNEELTSAEVELIMPDLSSRALQSFSMYLISANEEQIFNNANSFVRIGFLLLDKLFANNLRTEHTQLNLFLGRIAAPLQIAALDAEGTFRIADKKGGIWYLTVIRTDSLDLIAALADENRNVFRTFYSIKYFPKDNVFMAQGSVGQQETDNSMINFKIDANKNIVMTDMFGPDLLKNVSGKLVEQPQAQSHAKVLASRISAVYEGSVAFSDGKPAYVKLSIEFDGISTTARMTDKFGIIYDFTKGFFNEAGEFSLTSSRIPNMTWVQLRGNFNENEIRTQVIIGGRGFITKPFVLKRMNP